MRQITEIIKRSLFLFINVNNHPNAFSYICTIEVLLTLFLLGGGGQFAPPLWFFLHNSKSIGLRLLKFSDFSYIPKALPLGLKPGFNTNCLSPQAYCLNDCFFL